MLGSKSVVLDDVFALEHPSVVVSDLFAGTPPAALVHPHYRVLRAPRWLRSEPDGRILRRIARLGFPGREFCRSNSDRL